MAENFNVAESAGRVVISIVVSVYNEAGNIRPLYEEIVTACAGLPVWEILFVNDGSTDGSHGLLNELAATDKQVKVLHFSRNFGHEAAMAAGMTHAVGDCIVFMDCDLQHPPALIPSMYGKYTEGHDIVLMRRDSSHRRALSHRLTTAFYSLFNRLSNVRIQAHVSDFMLISKRVATVLNRQFNEHRRFLRGFVQYTGFPSVTIPYQVPARHAGKSKYSLLRLLFFSLDVICSFSNFPLYLALILGACFAVFAFFYLVYALVVKIAGIPVEGWTSLLALFALIGGVQLIILGIIGKYIGLLVEEIKARPLYIIQDSRNLVQDNR